jgi:hypothetical protein
LEYSGIDPANPVDTVAGAIGTNATTSSGAVTTANATDLLVGANTVETMTTGAGSGFTLRLLTNPDANIAEDRTVTEAGSYSASAPLNEDGQWVMQMVAFRAAGSSPTPTPTPTPTPVTTAYVQGNYAAPQTATTTITVPYPAAQKAGDLNVVIVGWNDSNTYPTALGDSNNNTYQLAVGTLLPGSPGFSQMIVYASNISAASAGGNAVTLTFNAPTPYANVEVLEYSGINTSNPFDVAVGSSGNSATSNSGSVTTTNATDLLVGANVVWTGTSGPGSGFTQRLLSNPDSDIAEDRNVTTAGSYSASAPLTSAGPWIMQMAAFRAASSTSSPAATPTPTPQANPTPTPQATPTPTPTGTPEPSPTPTPGGTPAVLDSVTLAWNADAATGTPATNPAGYEVQWGVVSGLYTGALDVGNNTTATVPDLISGTTYYFVVTAYNSAGVAGSPSNQLTYQAP